MSKITAQQLMRSLHRDIGFIMIGLTLIYALTGVLLVYRGTDFLKTSEVVTKKVQPDLTADKLGEVLHMRLNVTDRNEGSIMFMANNAPGIYSRVSGDITYTDAKYPAFIDKLVSLHKITDKDVTHYFNIVYGVMLLFLAISSFWMYKPGTKLFKRGMTLFGVGAVLALALISI